MADICFRAWTDSWPPNRRLRRRRQPRRGGAIDLERMPEEKFDDVEKVLSGQKAIEDHKPGRINDLLQKAHAIRPSMKTAEARLEG